MGKLTQDALVIFDHDGTLVNTELRDYALFPGIKELLLSLKLQGFKLSVWTARSSESTKASLSRLEIYGFFEEIYGHDNGFPKPHPMGLENLSAGFEKSQVLHIGDSLADLDGALNFGIDVIYACWNNSNRVQNFKEKTTMVAMSPKECDGLISKKFMKG